MRTPSLFYLGYCIQQYPTASRNGCRSEPFPGSHEAISYGTALGTENERFWAAKSIINLNDNWFSEIPQHHIRQAAAAAAAAAPAVQHDSREIHQDMQRWPTCSAHNKKRMRRRHKRYIRIPGIYSPDDPNHALLQHRRGIIGICFVLFFFVVSVFAIKVVRPKFTQKIPPKELN